MIKYNLFCKDCDTNFDSWFASSKEYERLKKKNFLNCHLCGSLNVKKSLMAPKLISKSNTHKTENERTKYFEIKEKIKDYQKFIKKNFEYVGENFTYEARSLHYGDKKKIKNIYGNASKEDLKELREEGIDAQVIPWVDDKNS